MEQEGMIKLQMNRNKRVHHSILERLIGLRLQRREALCKTPVFWVQVWEYLKQREAERIILDLTSTFQHKAHIIK